MKTVFSSLTLRLLTPFVEFFQSSRRGRKAQKAPASTSPSPELLFPNMECSVCSSIFDIEEEGGINGTFEIIPVAFCPWCYSSITDMVEQMCFRCQESIEEEEESSTTIN